MDYYLTKYIDNSENSPFKIFTSLMNDPSYKNIINLIDEFNNNYNLIKYINFESFSDNYYNDICNLLSELFLSENYLDFKFNNLKNLLIDFLISDFDYLGISNIIKYSNLYKKIYEYIFILNEYNKDFMFFKENRLIISNFNGYIKLLFLLSNNNNLYLLAIDIILNEIYVETKNIYHLLIILYLNIEIHPNFKEILKLLSSKLVKFKKQFNGKSIDSIKCDIDTDIFDYFNLLIDVLDYCKLENWISEKDCKFYTSKIINNLL